MAEGVDVSDYQRLIAQLKGMDRKVAAGIRKRLRLIGQDVGAEVVLEGAASMPARGGLRAHLESAGKVGVSILGTRATINLSDKAGVQLKKLDEGSLRHPVFGHRPWVAQRVPAATYTAAFLARREVVAAELLDEVESILRELA